MSLEKAGWSLWGVSSTSLAGNEPLVLVVEDDRDMLTYIHSCRRQDYQLQLAYNGREDLQLLGKHSVDLVLSYLMMPEMDGLQLLKIAKERFPDLPFVLLTARVEAQDRLSALQLGVDDYLTKPFLEAELLARLRNLIGRYETRRAMRLVPLPADVADTAQPLEQPANRPDSLNPDGQWLAELEALVKARLHDARFSVPQLAQALNITERTLQYKLKSLTGLTPNRYLMEARRLLESGRYDTVGEVCYAVGMKTTQYSARLMRERFGKLPSEYLGGRRGTADGGRPCGLLGLFRRGHRRGKKALFFPLCAFFRSNSWAILPKKAFKWEENSTFFPLR